MKPPLHNKVKMEKRVRGKKDEEYNEFFKDYNERVKRKAIKPEFTPSIIKRKRQYE